MWFLQALGYPILNRILNSACPAAPDDVTEAWLTGLLHERELLDAERSVASVSWQKLQAGLGSLAVRLDVRYDGETDAPTSFFGKFLLEDQDGKLPEAARDLAKKEVYFYNEMADAGIRTPKCYYAGFDDQNLFILLELLPSSTWPDQFSSASPAQTSLVIKAMATMHARWWQDAALAEADWLQQDLNIDAAETSETFRAGISMFTEEYGQQFPNLNEAGKIFAALLDKAPNLIKPRKPTSKGTLLHGDLRLDNLCFVDDEVILTDWQLVRFGNAIVDLTFWLCCNYEPSARRAQESHILEQYSAELKRHGIHYPVKKLRKDIRFQLIGRCMARLGSYAVTRQTVFSSDHGEAFLHYDLQGIEAMLNDYEVLSYLRFIARLLSVYAGFLRLTEALKDKLVPGR